MTHYEAARAEVIKDLQDFTTDPDARRAKLAEAVELNESHDALIRRSFELARAVCIGRRAYAVLEALENYDLETLLGYEKDDVTKELLGKVFNSTSLIENAKQNEERDAKLEYLDRYVARWLRALAAAKRKDEAAA